MFEKRKLEKIRPVLHEIIANDFHLGGLKMASGKTKRGRKYTGTYAKVKTLNETLRVGLGENGGLILTYRTDKTLTLKLTFSWSEGEIYDQMRTTFYEDENEEADDGLPEDLQTYHELLLNTFDDDGYTEITYTVNNVDPATVGKRAKILLGHALNIYDIYLENLLEEYGEE